MKKHILFFLVALISFSASARFYGGGTLGFGVLSVKEDSYSSSSTTALTIAPEIGYSFNPTWSLGASVSFDLNVAGGSTVTQLSVLPYVRATVARYGIFDFFGELAIGFGHQSWEGYGVDGVVSAIRPGFAAHITENFALTGRTNLLGYQHFDGWSYIRFGINNGTEIGVQFSF